jgi:hypothetical protein
MMHTELNFIKERLDKIDSRLDDIERRAKEDRERLGASESRLGRISGMMETTEYGIKMNRERANECGTCGRDPETVTNCYMGLDCPIGK